MKAAAEKTDGSITMHSTSLADNDLDNYSCPICNNTGYILWKDENDLTHSLECKCMKTRLSIRRLKNSGLQNMVSRYRFDNYQTPTEKNKVIKAKAMEFAENQSECFVIMGKSGSGKTHICTAICSRLIERGWNLKYMLWRTEAAELKAMVNDAEEYKQRITQLRNVQALYIDDLFKGSITDADLNLAFTILNDRYNSVGKKTIISTERSMEEIIKKDEAVGGRIVERARGYTIKAPDKNWRLSGKEE